MCIRCLNPRQCYQKKQTGKHVLVTLKCFQQRVQITQSLLTLTEETAFSRTSINTALAAYLLF